MSVHFAHASRLKLMVSLFAGDFGKLMIDHRASIAEVLSSRQGMRTQAQSLSDFKIGH